MSWTVQRSDQGLRLELDWKERGGPVPKRGRRVGFGSRLNLRGVLAGSIDGLSLIETLRAQGKLTPVIILSAYGARNVGRELGAQARVLPDVGHRPAHRAHHADLHGAGLGPQERGDGDGRRRQPTEKRPPRR